MNVCASRASDRVKRRTMMDSKDVNSTISVTGRIRKMPDGTLVLPPDTCRDTSNERVVNLRADGIACVPALERLHCKSVLVSTSEEHIHDGCVEIVFCQRGELIAESKGASCPFRPGMVFVSRPDEPHRLSLFPRGMSIYAMLFRVGRRGVPVLGLSPRESDGLRDAMRALPRRLFTGGDDVRLAFQRVFRVYDTEKQGTPWRLLRLRVAVLDLLFAVIDAAAASYDPATSNQLESVVAEIRANPAVPFTLDELTTRTRVSSSNLVRQFKQLTGLPPLAFRNSCRIRQAKLELADAKRSIGSIALRLGYSSTQNFATSFRLATGQTPRAWRERCLHSRQSNK